MYQCVSLSADQVYYSDKRIKELAIPLCASRSAGTLSNVMWSDALESQPLSSSITSYNNSSILHKHHTHFYPLL